MSGKNLKFLSRKIVIPKNALPNNLKNKYHEKNSDEEKLSGSQEIK